MLVDVHHARTATPLRASGVGAGLTALVSGPFQYVCDTDGLVDTGTRQVVEFVIAALAQAGHDVLSSQSSASSGAER